MDERDPGADTAMFRAYVERQNAEEAALRAQPARSNNRGVLIGAGVAVLVVLVLLVALAL
jgi:hypothetical protein